MSSTEDTPPQSAPESPAIGEATPSEPPPSVDRGADGRALRAVFYAIWLGIVPLALAVGNVWLLTPAPAALPNESGLRVFVADQPIPTGIVLFTLFAMVIWRFRHDLPFAAVCGVGGRRDVPAAARARFEDAGALVEEARTILRTYRRDVERELTATEREAVSQALSGLERIMLAERFDAQAFDAAHARADRIVGEHLSRWRKGEMREYAESIGIAVAVALLLRAFVVEAFKIPSGSMIPTLMIGDHIFVNKFTYGPLVPWTDKRLFSRLPPQRADVMVFKFPENKEQDFIKRVIAEPGDTLEVINGRPIINGWLVPHCRVGKFWNDPAVGAAWMTLKAKNDRDPTVEEVGRATGLLPEHVDVRRAELFIEYLGDKSYFTLFDNDPDEQRCDEAEGCRDTHRCKAGFCGVLQGPFEVAPEEVWVMGDNRNNSHDSRSWRGGLGAGVPFENIKGRAMFVWMSLGPGSSVQWDRVFVNVLGRPKLSAVHEAALGAAVDKCLRERPPVSQTTPPPSKRRP